jgi:hypothetical protein
VPRHWEFGLFVIIGKLDAAAAGYEEHIGFWKKDSLSSVMPLSLSGTRV